MEEKRSLVKKQASWMIRQLGKDLAYDVAYGEFKKAMESIDFWADTMDLIKTMPPGPKKLLK